MAGSFRIAEGYVEVTADEDPYDRAMARLRAKRHTVKVGVDLDDRDALAKLERLARTRTVQVKVKLDQTALAGLSAKNFKVKIAAELDEVSRTRVVKALDRLTADRVVRIRADVDTRVGAEEIRNLVRRQRVRIGVDVDTRVAADDIANLTRRRMLRVEARASTDAVADSIRFLTRDRTVNVRARMGGLGGLAGLGSSMGQAGASAGMLGSRFMMLAAAALGALPTVASLASSIAQMGPAAALAAPALGSLITMGAALGVGLHGLGDAFKSAFETGASSATSAASAARSLESAQINVARAVRRVGEVQAESARRIADAQKAVKAAVQGVRDAETQAAEERAAAARRVEDAQRDLDRAITTAAANQRRAAQQVADAEERLADAQRDAQRAQEDLTDARQSAAEQLIDLHDRLTSAELDQREAVIRVTEAQADLAAVMASGKSTALDKEKAQLALEQAVQGLKEQTTETERLKEEAAEANAAGVEGSEAVQDAQQGVVDATDKVADAQKDVADAAQEAAAQQAESAQQVADAQRNLADAQKEATKAGVDGARQVAAAQEQLRDAQQGMTDAQVDGARQVRDAQEAVADAARAMAAAQAQGSAEAIKFNDAMSKLSPNARSFVEAVKGIAPAWSAVRVDVQDALFRGLGATLTRMSSSVLPAVRGGLVGMAGVLNNMGKGLMNTFARLGDSGLLKRMFDGFTNGMKPLEKVPGQIGQAFVQISVAAAPAFKRLTESASGAMTKLSEKLTKAFESGRMEAFIDRAVEVAKQFASLIGDIFGTVSNVMKAAADGGGDALGGLSAVFKELRRVTALPEVQQMLSTIFKAISDVAKLLAGTLGAVIQAALPLLAAMAPVVSQLAENLGPLLAALAGSLGKMLMPIMQALLPVVGMLAEVLMEALQSVMPLLGPIGSLAAAIVQALAPAFAQILPAVLPVIDALVDALVPIISDLIPIVGIVGDALTQLAPVFTPLVLALLPLIPPLGEITEALLKLALQVIVPLMPLIVGLSGLLAGTLTDAINVLVPAITKVIGWITDFVDSMTAGVKDIVDWFRWMYDTLVGHSIIPDLVKAIVRWFTSLWTSTKKIFTDLKNGIVDRWNALWTSVRNRWDGFWSGLRNAIGGAKTSITNWATGLRTSVTNTWNSMWNGARDKVSSIFTSIRDKVGTFKTSMQNAISTLRDNLGNIWNGIRSKFSSPIKFVIGSVYNDGIRAMWNTIASKISSSIKLPAIGLKFAKGGIVPGSGTGDTVPAMLTPKERVLSLGEVAKLGGHRAINAMLGKDKPTGIGGNPNPKQEQARQGFAKGGIVGTIQDVGSAALGALGSGMDWAKDLVVGGLKTAAQKAISSLVRPLINAIPGGGSPLGKQAKGIPNTLLSRMLGFLGNEDDKAVGGPGVQKALSWARTQHGKPYQWGGNGNPSWDCSGLTSAIESVIRGESPHRRWATGSFSGGTAAPGWVRNLVSPYMIGITNAGVGHTAGTIGGVNVESRGGDGIIIGRGARGYNDPLFTDRYGFQPATKFDEGGILPPGLFNGTKRPERVLDANHTARLDAILNNASTGGGGITIQTLNLRVEGTFDFASSAERKRAANALVAEMKEALRVYDRGRN